MSTASWRSLVLRAAGALLIAMAAISVIGSPSVGLLLFSLPPLAAGMWVLALRPWSRALAAGVAVVYATIVWFVATTPLRGVTPPPGQGYAPMDPGTVVVACGFTLAAVLGLLGKQQREPWTKQQISDSR